MEKPSKQWSKPPQMVIDPQRTYTATLKTDKGDIVCALYANKVPKTVNNFVFLAREGYYDNTIFHRVITDFMAQGGLDSDLVLLARDYVAKLLHEDFRAGVGPVAVRDEREGVHWVAVKEDIELTQL